MKDEDKRRLNDIEFVKECLNLCEREELRDHAFGDREIFWSFNGHEVAGAYFGSVGKSLWIYDYDAKLIQGDSFALASTIADFEDDEARELVECGKLTKIERNDMQGDDIPRYHGA